MAALQEYKLIFRSNLDKCWEPREFPTISGPLARGYAFSESKKKVLMMNSSASGLIGTNIQRTG